MSYNKGDIDKEFFKELYNSPEIITKFQMICKGKPTSMGVEKALDKVSFFLRKNTTRYSKEAQDFKNFLDNRLSKLKNQIQCLKGKLNVPERLLYQFLQPLKPSDKSSRDS